jgi:hypothetical protein
MQRLLIQTINFSLLFILLVGVPAVTHAQLGHWEVASAPTARRVIFWGLGMAAGLNAIGALFLIKNRKDRKHGWEWAAIFGTLWLAYFGFVRGWFNFEWLKQALLWLQKHF